MKSKNLYKKGYIHVYTGDGKGKSTAAFTVALRTIGAGGSVYIAQFVKDMKYSDVIAMEQFLPNVQIKQYGNGCFIFDKPKQIDIEMAKSGLNEVAEIIKSGEYDLVILDEANIAIHFDLFSAEDLIAALKEKTEHTEIIITGRYAKQELIDFADLVTEMKEVKHYYTQGVLSRKGIDC